MHVWARAFVICISCAKAAELGCLIFEGSVLPVSSKALTGVLGRRPWLRYKGSVVHRFLPGMIDIKLRKHKKFIPISHGGRHKASEHHLNKALHVLCLTMSLRMKHCRHVARDAQAIGKCLVRCRVLQIFFWVTGELFTLHQMMEVPNEPGLCPNTGLENTS